MVNYDLTLHIPFPARSGGAVIASQALTVSTTAVSFTAYTDAQTDFVVFSVSTSPVRVRWDGTSPTSTVGHLLLPNLSYLFRPAMFNGAKFIRDSTASADAALFASPLTLK